MNKLGWLLTIVFLSGCGKDPVPKSVSQLLDLFTKEARSYGFNFDIEDYDVRITSISGEAVGRCWYRGKGLNRGLYIELDSVFWRKADAEERELLFFHELGHCVLGQDHRYNRSIMKPSLFSGYFDDRAYYISELYLHGTDSQRGLYKDDDDTLKHIDCEIR